MTPSPQQEESTEVLLEQLKNPSLTESEIDRIKKKLDILKEHG